MKNTKINLGAIRKVAIALGPINQKVVYVGGATVSLYVNDDAADDVRPTKDVDISLEIVSVSELEKFREELIEKGFVQKMGEKVMCRFHFEDVMVDVMSTHEVGWASTDKWFKPGFAYLEERVIEDTRIRVLPLAYFLASKFNAYHDRGERDARTSHDFEDITYLLDNRTDLIEVVLQSPVEVKKFLQKEFKTILMSRQLQEAVLGNLYYETQAGRFNIIMDKLRKITA